MRFAGTRNQFSSWDRGRAALVGQTRRIRTYGSALIHHGGHRGTQRRTGIEYLSVTLCSLWLTNFTNLRLDGLYWHAVLGVVMQLDFAAGALLRRINYAAVKRPGIHVQADRPLVEFPRIVNPVHRL